MRCQSILPPSPAPTPPKDGPPRQTARFPPASGQKPGVKEGYQCAGKRGKGGEWEQTTGSQDVVQTHRGEIALTGDKGRSE